MSISVGESIIALTFLIGVPAAIVIASYLTQPEYTTRLFAVLGMVWITLWIYAIFIMDIAYQKEANHG
jgi:hypothetical protein